MKLNHFIHKITYVVHFRHYLTVCVCVCVCADLAHVHEVLGLPHQGQHCEVGHRVVLAVVWVRPFGSNIHCLIGRLVPLFTTPVVTHIITQRSRDYSDQ